MTPSEVSKTDWVCRFIPKDQWDEEKQEPMPSVFKASKRQLSVFHSKSIKDADDNLRSLCFGRFEEAGEAHFPVMRYIELAKGLSPVFDPNVYWRPEQVEPEWEQWAYAHVHVESTKGNSDFPTSYRSLLAQNAVCMRPR